MTLVVDARLIQRIVDASKENDEECAKPKGTRKGYMGHLTAISHSLINIATVTPAIERLLTENPGWDQFVRGELSSIRERENRSLAGYIPSEYGIAEESHDFDDYEDDDSDIMFEHTGTYEQHEYNPEDNDFRLDADDDSDDDDDDDEDMVVQSRHQEDSDEEDQPQKIKEEPETKEKVTEESESGEAPAGTAATSIEGSSTTAAAV